MKVNLDIFEMLLRLNLGYLPTIEQQEGFYVNLTVFKNVLSSAPYQEVILTEQGQVFYTIRRDADGVLHMSKSENGVR